MRFYQEMHVIMRKTRFVYVMSAFLLHIPNVSAQISEGGTPPSFRYAESLTLRSAAEKTKVPVDFYIEDLREVDSHRSREGSPMPVARLIAVDYRMENEGSRMTLPGGERIRQFHLVVPDAVAVMLYYRDFYIPEGGKLFVYSADKSQVLGAYTSRTHPSGGLFATEFIGGEELILEYVESEISRETPRIHIDRIGYGYNASALQTFCGITTRATPTSGSCMVNVNCGEGDAWQNEKKGICHMVQLIGKASYICTGSLMNNTAEDFKPLILTARHCATYTEQGKESVSEHVADSADMQQWLFYFHLEREGCSNSSLIAAHKTMTGCRLLVNTGTEGGSDGMLLLLNQMIPEEYDVFYNGWDCNDTPASSGVNLHHPNGDYMKISTYGTPARATTFNSNEFIGQRNAHWNVTFQQTANGHGVTEGGSSGSPLYNENKLVVGTLTGGNSSCIVPTGLNIYGKMSYHWDKFEGDSEHMDVWLDPLGSGVKTFAGRFRIFLPAPLNVKAVNQGQNILLTWDPPQSAESPEYYNVYRNKQKIGEAVITSFVDGEPITGSLVYSVSAVYKDSEESPFASTTLSYVKFKAPTDLKVEQVGVTDKVKLTWNAPVYEQTIYWGTLDPTYRVGFKGNAPFYYGQKWSREEISPLDGGYIKAVQFIPWENNTYEVYISQGDASYRQPLESSSLKNRNLNTITLDEPFLIDGSKSLIVSIYISHVGDDHSAICDDGPSVDGKGNLYSFDGEQWRKFYDETDPDEYNYNFIVSAIITSERRTVDGEVNMDNKQTSGQSAYAASVSGRGAEGEKRSTEIPGIILSEERTGAAVNPRLAALPFNETPVSIRSSMPAAFPEVTGYRIYDKDRVFGTVDAAITEYVGKIQTGVPYAFEVTASYGGIESEKSKTETIFVGIENIEDVTTIYPTAFSNYVLLKVSGTVARVDVISVSGKVCLAVDNPGDVIDTSSLSPGLYFFRLYDGNNRILKVVRAVKTS